VVKVKLFNKALVFGLVCSVIGGFSGGFFSAFGQNTKAQMNTEINTNMPDNTTGAITPAIARTTFSDMNASWQQAPQLRFVVSTTDTIALADYGHVVSYSSASPVTVTLPQATGSFSTFNVFLKNVSSGLVSVVPTTSTINGANSIPLAQNQGVWVISDGTNYQLGPGGIQNVAGCVSLNEFGGIANNSFDNSAALSAALNSLVGSGGCIQGGAGTYRFNSAVSYSLLSGNFSVALLGVGLDATTFTWPSAGGGLTFNFAGYGNSVHVADMSFTTGTTNGGTALTLSSTVNNNNSLFPSSDIRRVAFHGADGYAVTDYWTKGISIVDVGSVSVNSSLVIGSSTQLGTGLSIVGAVGTSTYATPLNVTDSYFTSLAIGLDYGSFVQGVTVNHTNFTGVISGIQTAGGLTGILDQLAIADSQFASNAANGNGVGLSTAVNNVTIVASRFILNNATDSGINLPQARAVSIVANNITGTSSSGQQGITIANTNALPCVISANTVNGLTGTGSVGITTGASTANCVVMGNDVRNTTIPAVDAGTGNIFWANNGFDTAWKTFTASPSCVTGSGTFTTTAARSKTVGKQTWVEGDFTITAIGTCTGADFQFNLPVTAQSPAGLVGQEIGVTGNIIGCSIRSTGLTTAGCRQTTNTALAVNDRFIFSGVYENQ
jgi:hypothetical protein